MLPGAETHDLTPLKKRIYINECLRGVVSYDLDREARQGYLVS